MEDTVRLPDGKTTTYIKYAPTKTHSVAVIALNDKREILLQREYSYPPDIIMWQLPGGSMQEGEDPIEAANRELSEESNVVGVSCKILGHFYPNNRRSDEKQYVVLCANLKQKKGRRDAEEFIETHWVPVTKLQTMITAGEITNFALLAAIAMYLAQATQG